MRFVLIGVLLAASACGDAVDRNIEDQITIQQGVYGLLVSGCDTSGCQDQPAAGETVLVYAPGNSHVLSTVTSDNKGVYQVDLEGGDYTLCTYSCTLISVPAAAKIRADWTSGPGGGTWDTL
ncbi:MAG TPA: hypothetical protein VLB44_08430 [Kofleriaceae bacterium]|nr:hypothetical protein [Kofleriaceae bacterium]